MRELELEELEESTLDWELELLLELLLTLLDFLLRETFLLRRREDELDDWDEEEDEMRELNLELLELLLDWDLRERELLDEEEDLVVFFRPGTRIFLSFSKTFFASMVSSSWLMLITLMIFSAAISPT